MPSYEFIQPHTQSVFSHSLGQSQAILFEQGVTHDATIQQVYYEETINANTNPYLLCRTNGKLSALCAVPFYPDLRNARFLRVSNAMIKRASHIPVIDLHKILYRPSGGFIYSEVYGNIAVIDVDKFAEQAVLQTVSEGKLKFAVELFYTKFDLLMSEPCMDVWERVNKQCILLSKTLNIVYDDNLFCMVKKYGHMGFLRRLFRFMNKPELQLF